jgi:hypothetical protein
LIGSTPMEEHMEIAALTCAARISSPMNGIPLTPGCSSPPAGQYGQGSVRGQQNSGSIRFTNTWRVMDLISLYPGRGEVGIPQVAYGRRAGEETVTETGVLSPSLAYTTFA